FPAKCTIQYRMRVPIPVCLRPCVRQNKFRPQVREQFPGPRFAPVQRAMAKYSAAMVEHESAERLQKVPALAAIREAHFRAACQVEVHPTSARRLRPTKQHRQRGTPKEFPPETVYRSDRLHFHRTASR